MIYSIIYFIITMLGIVIGLFGVPFFIFETLQAIKNKAKFIEIFENFFMIVLMLIFMFFPAYNILNI